MKQRRRKSRRDFFREQKGEREVSLYSALGRYEQFKEIEETLLKHIREDLAKGMSADDIYQKYENLAAARAVTLLAQSNESKDLIPVIREIRDRASGRPMEKKQVTHKLASLSDEELRALVASEMSESYEDLKK